MTDKASFKNVRMVHGGPKLPTEGGGSLKGLETPRGLGGSQWELCC